MATQISVLPPRVRLLPVFAVAAVIAALTCFGAFVLPFFFPPTHPTYGAAYTAGFNNGVATIATTLISVLTLYLTWRFDLFPRQFTSEYEAHIPMWLLAISIALCTAFTGGLGWMLCKAELGSADIRFFLESMDDVIRYHEHIYTDFSFNYGPLLLYYPVWIHRLLQPLHFSLEGSYFVALAIAEALGQVLLYFTLESLPISKDVKLVTFLAFTVIAMCPVLGMNYTFIRFLVPFSTLLFATRTRKPLHLALVFFLGELLQLAISPEMGMAFGAGACFYGVSQWRQKEALWVLAVAAPPLAGGIFLTISGRSYLHSITKFSNGTGNLVIEPLGYILLFLLAVVWLIPQMLAARFKRDQSDATLMASLFVLSIWLLPPALGRCDLLHVFFNGAGMYLLASVAISSYPRAIRQLWFLFLSCSITWMQIVNFYVRPDFALAPKVIHSPSLRNDSIDIERLEAITGAEKVATPFLLPWRVEMQLKQSGNYAPDQESDYISHDAESETARLHRMDTYNWALIPLADALKKETLVNTSGFLGIGYSFYPERRKPYIYGLILTKDLETSWTSTAIFGQWELYRHNPSNLPLSPTALALHSQLP
jgi:hypothetical protein